MKQSNMGLQIIFLKPLLYRFYKVNKVEKSEFDSAVVLAHPMFLRRSQQL
jgi:hypothetical protein